MTNLKDMHETPASLAAIAVQPPAVEVDLVAQAVREQFGLRGELTSLVSERDQNFRLSADDGRQYVVKIVSKADSAELVDFQVCALRHLEEGGFDRVPRVISTTSGNSLGEIRNGDGETLMLRVVSWVDGVVRRGSGLSVAAAHSFGESIAEFGVAMSGFAHAGENQSLLWDMRRAPELLALTAHIEDTTIRDDVESALRSFGQRSALPLSRMPGQVIHNDLNGGNVLFDGDRLVGIIDFGDMLRAPRIVDVAIAAAYLRDSEQPTRLIAPLLAGYAAHVEVNEAERAILFDLIRARLCATVTMLYWRMSQRPVDDAYRQKTIAEESGASDFLAALNQLGQDRFVGQVLPD